MFDNIRNLPRGDTTTEAVCEVPGLGIKYTVHFNSTAAPFDPLTAETVQIVSRVFVVPTKKMPTLSRSLPKSIGRAILFDIARATQHTLPVKDNCYV